jgi:tetratricopeptide (TPR) repeat protein
LDTVTYPDPVVSDYISSHFVSYEANMGERESWALFRANHVIWTPSVGFADHNGSIHHQSAGYLPPNDFLSALKIGRARCLIAWTRSAEAIKELESAASIENAMTPEALFWLSTAYFFERRDTTRMYETWEKLVELYPDSPWAHHTYPRPE